MVATGKGVVFLLLIVAGVLDTAVLADTRNKQTGFSYLQSPVELGRIDDKAITVFAVGIQNSSNAPLAIVKLETACGCTMVKDQPEILHPYSSAVVSLQLNPAGIVGPFSRKFTIYTRDRLGKQSAWPNSFSGTVNNKFRVTPRKIYFGVIRTSEIEPISTDIEFSEDVNLDSVQFSSPHNEIRIVKHHRISPRKIRLVLTLEPSDFIGQILKPVLVTAQGSNGEVHRSEINVFAVVKR